MRRGTTPTLKIRVTGANLSEMENIYVTIKQEGKEVTKTGDEISTEGDMILVPLTQEDTLKFRHSCVWVQMRATTKDGLAVASNIRMLEMKDVLMDGVIE